MNDYPFELWVYMLVVAPSVDADGFKTGGVSEWVKHSDCYEQVMGQSHIVNNDNGESFTYSSKVFLPSDASAVGKGTKVQVRQDGSVRLEGIAKRFSRDLGHCRMWV
jgi:hypothetical protein